MDQMREVVDESIKSKSLNISQIFDTFDRSKNNQIEIAEFNELIAFLYEKRDRYEVDCLFRHCDLRGVGHISKEDF